MVIRDFVYVDGDRLYSLYSQVFEGVAEKIVQSYFDELSSVDTQKSSPLSGGSVATQVAEASRRTENRLLYDHMYSQLESKLAHALVDPSGGGSYDLKSLAQSFMVKVTGTPEIEDYRRLRTFLEQFNALGEAIAYAGITASGVGEQIKAMRVAAEQTKDRNARARAKKTADSINVRTIAESMGLRQDEQTLKNLGMFAELFVPEGFEVTLSPDAGGQIPQDTVYRGVLDKRWLRIKPELLRGLYGVSPVGQWTMVGQVTHVPGLAATLKPTVETEREEDSEDENPSMRDPFRAMFGASATFERMFLESKQRTEIIIAPLAIYREFKLKTPESGDSGE